MLAKEAFDICAFFVLLICFLAGVRWQREYEFQRKVLLLFIGLNMGMALVSVINSWILYYGREMGQDILWALMVTKTIAYVCNVTMPACFVGYLMCVAGVARAKSPSFYMLLFLPNIISIGAVITNPIHRGFFHYAPTFDYYRGPCVPMVYFAAVLYVSVGVYFLVRYYKAIEKQRLMGIISAIFIAVVFATLQFIMVDIRVEIFGVTLACLSLLVNVEINMNDVDSFSGCFNRSAFLAMARRNIIAGSKFQMVAVRFINLRECVRYMNEDTQRRLLQDLGRTMQRIDKSLQIYHTNFNTYVLVLVNKEPARFDALIERLRWIFENTDYAFEKLKLEFTVDISTARVPIDLAEVYEINEFASVNVPETGRQFMVHGEEVMQCIKRENVVETALRKAIKNRTLDVYYQPIVDLHTGRTVAAEALTRLYDPELGDIYPGEFIPIAEGKTLIADLGEYVLEETCKLLQNDNLYSVEYIEINLAPYQLMQADLADRFMAILHHYGITPNRINLEITEMAASEDMKSYERSISRLRKAGFTFSLDDFGTGYSNLARLFNMKFKNIKIDKSLLWDSTENEVSKKFLESMIQTIHNMNSSIIQEGVETKEQLAYVKAQGIDSVQGYIFAKPMAVIDFLEYIKRDKLKGKTD